MKTFQTESGAIRRHRIPVGYVWLQNDNNSADSLDSRNYGPVPTGLLYGKAVCRMSLTESPHFEVLSHEIPKPSSNTVKLKPKSQSTGGLLDNLLSFFKVGPQVSPTSYAVPKIESTKGLISSPLESSKKN